MKYLIASDLHGSAHCCRALLEAFDRGDLCVLPSVND